MANDTGNVQARTGSEGPTHPAPHRAQVGTGMLWFGLLGAPVAWSLQLIVMYATTGHSCYPHWIPVLSPSIGHTTLDLVLWFTTGVTLAIGVLSGLFAIRAWRQTRGEAEGASHWLLDTGVGRTRFMAASGIMTSLVFLLAMLTHAVSVAVVPICR